MSRVLNTGVERLALYMLRPAAYRWQFIRVQDLPQDSCRSLPSDLLETPALLPILGLSRIILYIVGHRFQLPRRLHI